jgi:hypothetical protein
MCPNHNGPLCTTCRLGGLIRCPILGVPLPLVDGEKPRVIRNRAFSVRVWPSSGDGVELRSSRLTEAERERIYQFLKDRGVFE